MGFSLSMQLVVVRSSLNEFHSGCWRAHVSEKPINNSQMVAEFLLAHGINGRLMETLAGGHRGLILFGLTSFILSHVDPVHGQTREFERGL